MLIVWGSFNTRLMCLTHRNMSLTLLGRLSEKICPLRVFVLSCYKYRCVCRPPWKKINITRNDHGQTQRSKFSVLDQKHAFWANLTQKIQIVSLSWNLVPRPIQICGVQRWCSLFLFSTRNTFFMVKLVQKTKYSIWVEIWYL